jgi:tetratricopeptide (TPR) repeat protein
MRGHPERLLIPLLLLASEPAFAQPHAAQGTADLADLDEARRFFQNAERALNEGRNREAALAFEASAKLEPNANAFYAAGQAWELAGDAARAADAYERSLDAAGLHEARAARAKERLAALQPELAELMIDGAPDTRVQLDDHMELAVPARLHAVSGEHTLLILKPDNAVDRRTLRLERGVIAQLNVDKPGAAKPRVIALSLPRLHPVRAEPETLRRGPWLAVGCAAAGLGVGALGGAVALAIAADDAADTYGQTPSAATSEHVQHLETSRNIVLATGAVLASLGAGILIWQGRF